MGDFSFVGGLTVMGLGMSSRFWDGAKLFDSDEEATS